MNTIKHSNNARKIKKSQRLWNIKKITKAKHIYMSMQFQLKHKI